MIKTTLAFSLAGLLAFAATCRTANDRPTSGPTEYKCADCSKVATADAGAPQPLCCGKTMQVTSTEFAEDVTYTCAACAKTNTAAAGAPAPS
jgi:DNA-directed RNA polymerase subunit RPC12/RpoP